METVVLEHSYLGRVTGIKKSLGIHQFLGIKYADIPTRFSEPVPHIPKDFNATRYGPQAPQGANTCEGEFGLIGEKLPLDDVINISSENECLTLNITVPVSQTDRKYKDLPVVVWVHGGNFQLGSSSWPQYDLAHLVSTSDRIGKPIVGISVKFDILRAAG
ncbi:hypothetical protein TWF694_003321 [Orbilia ellipsospora]|uniref:Carboxylesterase type B domain-containing protein n=1 Tax=Orbilia ellipsospora TaxID=2528407 RepID=A0AAV9X1D0_9PEZI